MSSTEPSSPRENDGDTAAEPDDPSTMDVPPANPAYSTPPPEGIGSAENG